MILHLINCHEDDEIRFRKVDGHHMRTIKFKAIPDLYREQGRTITIDEIKGYIHISRANVIPKASPLKKHVRLLESSSVDDQHDPLSNVALGQEFMEESNGTNESGCRNNTDECTAWMLSSRTETCCCAGVLVRDPGVCHLNRFMCLL
ncbi:hypothetical protein DPMN_009598 [Dreissena polymorpha]|uniref:Uncharacterized protein n=1 Tax=Dreissena polymorpha TaxID=45954 RepID=A0A9D4MX93_DREPO|nr:hypothetical protein DPMN_009598 [Dreissena polymorpha]